VACGSRRRAIVISFFYLLSRSSALLASAPLSLLSVLWWAFAHGSSPPVRVRFRFPLKFSSLSTFEFRVSPPHLSLTPPALCQSTFTFRFLSLPVPSSSSREWFVRTPLSSSVDARGGFLMFGYTFCKCPSLFCQIIFRHRFLCLRYLAPNAPAAVNFLRLRRPSFL